MMATKNITVKQAARVPVQESGPLCETTLATLAAQINAEHDRCEAAVSAAVEHAVKAGALLLEIKKALPHGAFLPWLKVNCTFSPRTAQAYMQIARVFPKLGNPQRVAHLSARQALKAIAVNGVAMAAYDAESQGAIVDAWEHAKNPHQTMGRTGMTLNISSAVDRLEYAINSLYRKWPPDKLDILAATLRKLADCAERKAAAVEMEVTR